MGLTGIESSKCTSDINPHITNSYEESLNMLANGDSEYAEFPLDSLGSSAIELIEISKNISRSCFGSYELGNFGKEESDKVLPFIENNFPNSKSELASSLERNMNETTISILQLLSDIGKNYRTALHSNPFPVHFLNWHSDYNPV